MTRWLGLAFVLSLALTLTARPHRAHAIASSCRYDGWGVDSGTVLPVHPRITYYTDARAALSKDSPKLEAKIAGKVVPTKITYSAAGPFELATIEVDSRATGKLELTWTTKRRLTNPSATFAIAANVTLPKEVHGKASRYHRAFHHSSVHEAEDGLAVTVDTTAVAFTARWRRDDKTAWQTLEIPGGTLSSPNVARLGEVGCAQNFSVPLLEGGIDLELTATLPDGTTRPVAGVPAHYRLPQLPKGADVSSP